eukprot:2410934-Rhodomonas_salina.2
MAYGSWLMAHGSSLVTYPSSHIPHPSTIITHPSPRHVCLLLLTLLQVYSPPSHTTNPPTSRIGSPAVKALDGDCAEAGVQEEEPEHERIPEAVNNGLGSDAVPLAAEAE